MKVYFSHGKESGPWGTKIKRLADIAEGMGCAVESVDYMNLMNPDLRVELLLEALAEERAGNHGPRRCHQINHLGYAAKYTLR